MKLQMFEKSVFFHVYPRLQSLSVKNQIPPFATFKSGPGGPAWNTLSSHIVLTLPIRLVGVYDPCLR